ncbi:MAG: DUF447 domain-containing protein [Burkholderiales bacterium]
MIFETIITTRSIAGKVHIAPMGVREQGGFVILAPFKPSTTLDNVLAGLCAVQNFCDDVRVFAGCVTGAQRDWPTIETQIVDSVRLIESLGHSELVLDHVEDDAQRPKLFCKRKHDAGHGAFRGFNRAQAAVIEASVLVSRLPMLPWEKISEEWKYLNIAIEKTAGPCEREAWGWLQAKLELHRAQQQGQQ